jgi:hypothetical protein
MVARNSLSIKSPDNNLPTLNFAVYHRPLDQSIETVNNGTS